MNVLLILGDVERATEHNHAPDIVDIETRKVLQNIKRSATSDDSKTSNTVRKAVANVPGQVGARLPNLQSLYRTVQRTREHEDVVVKNAKDLASMASQMY